MPQVDSMKKWAVIACDQFSSQPEYWKEVEDYVKEAPSTLHLMLPEAKLGSKDEDEKIRKIQSTMKNYVDNHLLKTYEQSFIYVERTLQNGKIRRGIIGAIDLEEYSYTPEDEAKIRSTEKTVMERIPPRMKIRYQAPIELPHVILLCDDWKNELLEYITQNKGNLSKLYEFDLMQKGGHIAVEAGKQVTVRLTPDYGYQLKGVSLNGGVTLAPQDEVSTFTFKMPDTNVHFKGIFIDIG
mgnify:CR=1 FL=1